MPTAALVGSALTRHIPLVDVVCDPCDNYRWLSQEAMDRDLHREGSNLVAMAESITKSGLLNPIGVRADGLKFRVIYGFNRFQAAILAKLPTIRAQVYDESVSESDVYAMQLTENNDDLRRSVSWIREMDQILKLHTLVEADVRNLSVADRPRTPSGALTAPRCVAWVKVGEMTGRSYMTLQERAVYLRCLDPAVLTLAREHDWTLKATIEFYSGDAKKGYEHAFILEVLKELRRNFPSMSATDVTATRVRATMTNVAAWLAEGRGRDGRALWQSAAHGVNLTTYAERAPVIVTGIERALTPTALRVVAQNVMFAAFKGSTLMHDAAEKVWDDLARSAAAYRVCGIGIATGDVVVADAAAESTGILDMADLAQRARHFLTQNIVHAATRHLVSQRHSWSRWVTARSTSASRAGSDRSNLCLFNSAVREGLSADGATRDKVMSAWSALCASGAVNA